jgi:hypothetical protein
MHLLTVNPKYTGNSRIFTGWKEIANYLGKAVRTVQRYEQTLRLPVRRPSGKDQGSVLAIKAELDLWVLSATTRDSPETLKITLRVAEIEMQKLHKAVAQTRELSGKAIQLRAEFSVQQETSSHQMQLVYAKLALNEAENSNVTLIESVANKSKPPRAVG